MVGRRARRWATRLLCALAAAMTAGVALAPTAAAQQSDDATLASLSFESDLGQTRMFPAVFDPGLTGYEVAVPSGETEVTVVLEAGHPGASVDVNTTPQGKCCTTSLEADANANPGYNTYTLAMRTDRATYLAIDVTAEDGTENQYSVNLKTASLDALEWRVYNDVPHDQLVDDSRLPSHYLRGVWAGDVDGVATVLTTSWRHDPQDQKLHAFNAADSSRRTADDFVPSDNPDAGIWSNGEKLWALDSDGWLRVYNLPDGSEITGSAVDLTPDGYHDRARRELGAPRGIWSDGSTLWVADRDKDKVFVS